MTRLHATPWAIRRLDTRVDNTVIIDSPALSTNPMMHTEEHARIILPLDLLEPRMIGTSERLLPIGLGDVGLITVGAFSRSNFAQQPLLDISSPCRSSFFSNGVETQAMMGRDPSSSTTLHGQAGKHASGSVLLTGPSTSILIFASRQQQKNMKDAGSHWPRTLLT
jgi:hypothetical protein